MYVLPSAECTFYQRMPPESRETKACLEQAAERGIGCLICKAPGHEARHHELALTDYGESVMKARQFQDHSCPKRSKGMGKGMRKAKEVKQCTGAFAAGVFAIYEVVSGLIAQEMALFGDSVGKCGIDMDAKLQPCN